MATRSLRPRRGESGRVILDVIGIMTWLGRRRSVAQTSITAVTYVGLFALTNWVVRTRPSSTQRAFMNWASTDLVNLRAHPVGAMVVSAFVDDSNILEWIALGLIGLVCAGHTLGNLRCVAVCTVAHVVGTLVSEGILATRIADGAVPVSQRTILDIGPSYVVVAGMIVGIAYGRWPARIASAVAFALLSPHLFGGLTHLGVGAVGHCTVIVVSLAMGYVLQRSRRHQRRHQLPH